MKLTQEYIDLVWDATVERVSKKLLEDPNMTLEKHARIMKDIRAIHETTN